MRIFNSKAKVIFLVFFWRDTTLKLKLYLRKKKNKNKTKQKIAKV